MAFTHLHVHSEYSLLDGVSKVSKLFERVKELNMNSVALTDHGVMYGATEFWKYSKEYGIKPIIGCEIYLAPKERDLRELVDGIKYYHLILIAKNLTGYKNLLKLVSIGQLEGMYYKPRVDRETLQKYSEGLICTSACLAGPLSRNILKNNTDKAVDWLKFLKDTYKENFYLELQRNGFSGSDELILDQESRQNLITQDNSDDEVFDDKNQQKKVNLKLREFAQDFNINLIATTDAHYLRAEDRDVQTVLFCIKDGKLLSDTNKRVGYEGTYVAAEDEMREKFKDIPDALDNTVLISDSVENYSISFDRVQPKFWNLAETRTAQEELKIQTFEGALKKYVSEDKWESNIFKEALDEIKYSKLDKLKEVIGVQLFEKIEFELKIIHDKGYDDYFLVVSDLMKWAASQKILMGVRGSVAGSIAAHCLDIVEVDPIKWELYFERFLNPERPSPPDIDMDIQDDRRDEVIKYVEEKYGKESVAAIIALGKLTAKAAIRDVSRVMGIDLKIADQLSKMVKVVFGKVYPLKKMFEEDKEFERIIKSDPELEKMAEYVQKIDSIRRHVSVHACGYLITPGPLTNYVPLQYESGGDRVIVQYEGPWLEELGLMKFDFLGLRTLTIIKNTLNYIKINHKVDIDFYKIPETDKKTFELFSRGDTIGVFQFESPPMQQYLRELNPESLEDICFLVAAYRPGPMKYIPDYIARKHGKQEVKLLIPQMEPIVQKTYGFAIYQEQVIRIAVNIAGYSMGGADVLRRAMGKKKVEVMQKEEVKFKEGIKQRGFDDSIGTELWKYLLPFADYGFNKAHAAGYAVLAYKCAYLKAHYPLEYMMALMHSDLGDSERISKDLIEAKKIGYQVLPPDINKSDIYFSTENGSSIRFGLGAIKNVGIKVCEDIINDRKEDGLYTSFEEFISRLEGKSLNKRSVEALIKSGALDSLGERNLLLKIMPEVMQKTVIKQKEVNADQFSMFIDEPETEKKKIVKSINYPEVEAATDNEKMNWEKELLGLFITTHPLTKFSWVNIYSDYAKLNQVDDLPANRNVKLLATIATVKTTFTKKDNQKMAILTLEDDTDKADAVIFPKTYEKYNHLINELTPLILRGTINVRDERKSIIINEMEHANTLTKPKRIDLSIIGIDDKTQLDKLKSCLKDSGDTEVNIQYGLKSAPKILKRYINLDDQVIIQEIRKWIN